MAEERIDIVVAQRGATEVKRSLEEIGQAAGGSRPAADSLRQALASLLTSAERLRVGLPGASSAADELRRQLSALDTQMGVVSGAGFVMHLKATEGALNGVTAAAVRAAGGVAALGEGFMMMRGMAAAMPSSSVSSLGNMLPQIAQANQLLLTYDGTVNRAAASGGLFAGVMQRMQGMWGAFTGGVRSAWSAVTGLASSLQGSWTNMTGMAAATTAAGAAAQSATQGVQALELSFFSLWRIILAVTIAAQVWRGITGAIDEWIGMSNRLRQVADDADNLAASQDAIYESAQRTRSGMDEMATLYARTTMATKDLGLSQRDILEITENVAMAMKLNGGTVQETASAMRQLSQAFNKGKLDGDEFRSIMENAPALQKAFTDGLKVTKAELYEMSEAGELTLPKLIKALQDAGPAIRESFEDSLPTISEGFQYLGNSITAFLGRLNEATGFSRAFYDSMKFLGDNLGVLGVALAVVGTAILVAFGPAAIAAVASFGAALAVATGGLSLILPILAGLVAATYAWGDSWTVTADGISVLDYIRAALEMVGSAVSTVTGLISTGFSLAWEAVQSDWGGFASFFGGLLSSVGSLMEATASTYIGAWVGAYNAIIAAWNGFPAAIVAVAQMAMNAALDVVQGGINGMIGAINTLLEAVSAPTVPTVDLSGWKAEVSSGVSDLAGSVGEGFSQGMQTGRDAIQGMLSSATGAMDALTSRAREINANRRVAQAFEDSNTLSSERGPNTYTAPVDKGAAKRAQSEAEKLENQLNSLLRTIDPITGAQERLRAGTETLDKAYAAGLITLERRDDLLGRLKERLRDQLDPLGSLNRDMAEEADLLRLGNGERVIQKQLLEDIEKLRRSGVNLGPAEVDQLEQSIRAMEQLKEQSRLLGDVLGSVFKGAESAFTDFIETGKVNFSDLVTSMLSDVARLAFQSFVTKPLTNMLGNVLGNILPGASGTGGGSGILGNLFGGLFGGGAGAGSAGNAGLYATGGGFTVDGSGGVDSQMVQFRATPGERVTVSRAGSEGSNGNSGPKIVFNIQTPDVQGFRASEAQIAARMARLAGRGNRNL